MICRKYEETMGKKIAQPKTNDIAMDSSTTVTDSIRGANSGDDNAGVANTLVGGLGSVNTVRFVPVSGEGKEEERAESRRPLGGSLSNYPSADTALLELKVT